MLFWLFSLILPNVFSNVINTHNTHINYDLVYQGNLDLFQNNSLRFSSALQEKYHLFNIDYDYSMYPCFELCTDIPGCVGIFNLPGTCIGLSYLGEHPHTTIIPSQSYEKIVDLSFISNLSCFDRCGIGHHFSILEDRCWCDVHCPFFNDCCGDYNYYCIDHCLDNNGGCSQLCETINSGTVNCSCNPGFFLGDDLITCHPENSVVGKIFDNIHEIHVRNVTILLKSEEQDFTLVPNFHGEFILHNLSEGNYTLQQILNSNCTQRLPIENKINITLPTDTEYDFYNFCGLNCRCADNYYLSECNYLTGFGTCNQCDVCEDTHLTIQACTKISNTVCELISSSPTSTQTSSQTSTLTSTDTSSPTSTPSSTATSSQTTSKTSTLTTTITTTDSISGTTSGTTTGTTSITSTPTITFKISNNQGSSSNSTINYQTITIVLASLLLVLILLVSLVFIKYQKNERTYSVSQETPNTNNNTSFTTTTRDTFSNPVFYPEPNENENAYYQDVSFEEPDNNLGYMDVAPVDQSDL